MTETVVTSAHEQLQRLLDIEEIRKLLADYGRVLDQRDFKAYSELFTVDGEWNGVGHYGAVQGRQAILEFMVTTIGAEFGAEPTGSNHIMTNMMIDVEDGAATAWSRWTLVDPTPEGRPQLVFSGHYEDVLAREDGRWRFRRRAVFVDIPEHAQDDVAPSASAGIAADLTA